MNLSHNVGFSDVDPNAISLKYSMYTLANNGDTRDLFVGICQTPF